AEGKKEGEVLMCPGMVCLAKLRTRSHSMNWFSRALIPCGSSVGVMLHLLVRRMEFAQGGALHLRRWQAHNPLPVMMGNGLRRFQHSDNYLTLGRLQADHCPTCGCLAPTIRPVVAAPRR